MAARATARRPRRQQLGRQQALLRARITNCSLQLLRLRSTTVTNEINNLLPGTATVPADISRL